MPGARFLPLLAAALLTAGCAATGPAFTDAPPPGQKALVYLYRPYNQWVSAQDAGFDANGKRVGFLDPGGYTFFHAAPGHYDIRLFWPLGWWTVQAPALWEDMHVATDLQAGETRYFRLEILEVALALCSGPSSSVTELDGSESRYFEVGSSVYDPNTGSAFPAGNWCVRLNLSEVGPAIARGEIQAQKFQAQNKAMPADYRP